MHNTKTTKRALGSSILALFLCTVMLVGTTFAWFTDTAATAVNKIQAGTLDVQLLDENGNSIEGETLTWKTADDRDQTDILWEPGATYELQSFQIKNNGNLALKYKISVTGIVGDSELLDAIEFTVSGFDAETAADLDGYEGSLDAYSSTELITITGHMKESAGNEYQDLSIDGIGITVVATQDTVEYDSYDNQYDKNANPDAVFGTDIITNLNDPDVTVVVAGENIDMSDSTFQTNTYGNAQFDIPDGKTLDLNNSSIIRPDGGSGSGFKFSKGVTATLTNGYVINEGSSTAIDLEYGTNATFENVTFKGNGDSMIRVRSSGSDKTTVVFKDCTFENAGVVITGMNGASEVDIQFINCTFTGSYCMYDEDGNKLANKYGNAYYMSSMINVENNYTYGNISFDNCTFDYDAHEASYAKKVIALYGCYQSSYPGKILNVTLNDVTITAQNANPVSTDSRYASGLNIVETGSNSYTKDGVAVNYKGVAQ